jgi:hypothetical protein
MSAFLQAIDAGEVHGVLVEILEHVSHKENGDDSKVDLPKHSFDLCWIRFNVFGISVKFIIVVVVSDRAGRRDVIGSIRGMIVFF